MSAALDHEPLVPAARSPESDAERKQPEEDEEEELMFAFEPETRREEDEEDRERRRGSVCALPPQQPTTFRPIPPRLSTIASVAHMGTSPDCPADFNGRRKRRCMDDILYPCVVRPVAKRIKSCPFVQEPKPTMTPPPWVAAASASESKVAPWVRSASISIPKRPSAAHRSKSAQAPSKASVSLLAPANASGSASSSSSAPKSWNTSSSFEYFCRRSLDVSSPLRARFRDLVVGSVGRTASYNTP